MINLILFLLYTTLSSNVYALIPIIIILIFILAAAGLTRGVSIFNLFGIGALMGIGGGVGKGGAGKGLKAASAVRRNKIKATMAKSPKGLRNLSKRLGVRHLTTHLQKKQRKYLEKAGKSSEKAKNAKTNLGKKFYGWRERRNAKKAAKVEKKINKITGGKINLAITLAALKKPLSKQRENYIKEGLKSKEFQGALKNYYNKIDTKLNKINYKILKIEKLKGTYESKAQTTQNKILKSYYQNKVEMYTTYQKELQEKINKEIPKKYRIAKGGADIILGNVPYPTFSSRAKETLNSARPSSYSNYTEYFEAMTRSRVLLATETAGVASALYVASLLFRKAKAKKQQQGKGGQGPPPQPQGGNQQGPII